MAMFYARREPLKMEMKLGSEDLREITDDMEGIAPPDEVEKVEEGAASEPADRGAPPVGAAAPSPAPKERLKVTSVVAAAVILFALIGVYIYASDKPHLDGLEKMLYAVIPSYLTGVAGMLFGEKQGAKLHA